MTDDKTHTPGEAAPEAPLPALTMREVVERRSKSPVNMERDQEQTPERPLADRVQVVQAFGDYTIVCIEGNDEIQVFDVNGNKVEDFTPKSRKSQTVNWPEIGRSLGKKHIISEERARSGPDRRDRGGNYDDKASQKARDEEKPISCSMGSLPDQLLELLRPRLNHENRNKYLSFEEKLPEEALPMRDCRCSVVEDGKYVIFYDPKEEGNEKNDVYMAFLTQDEAGEPLPPRSWKRIDNLQYGEQYAPPDLIPHKKNGRFAAALKRNELRRDYERLHGDYKDLNETYAVNVVHEKLIFLDRRDYRKRPHTEEITEVKNNICADPANPNMVYFCRSENPAEVIKLDMSDDDPQKWRTASQAFPGGTVRYSNVDNLQFDPTGNFLIFNASQGLVVVDKDTLEEIHVFEGENRKVTFDPEGRIRRVNDDGYVVFYEINFREIAKARMAKKAIDLASGVNVAGFFRAETIRTVTAGPVTQTFEELTPLKTAYESQAIPVVQGAATLKDIEACKKGLDAARVAAKKQGLPLEQANHVTSGISAAIQEKEKEIATKLITEVLDGTRAKLAGTLSLAIVGEASEDMRRVESMAPLVDDVLRQRVRHILDELRTRSAEFFSREEGVVIRQLEDTLEGVEAGLKGFSSKIDFDDWQAGKYYEIRGRLMSVANHIPAEAVTIHQKVVFAVAKLEKLAEEYKRKFEESYAEVRERAADQIAELIGLAETEIDSFVQRLRDQRFRQRDAAETYLATTGAKAEEAIRTEIAELAKRNPEAAGLLEKSFKVKIANALGEIERGAGSAVEEETGRQMTRFGNTPFPEWEARTKKKGKKKTELVFTKNERSMTGGVSADDVMGDVSLQVTTSYGKVETVRLYEGLDREDEWRLGAVELGGQPVLPSYLRQSDYRALKKAYRDWQRGEKSELRRKLAEHRKKLKEKAAERPKGVDGERLKEGDKFEAWKKAYLELVGAYAKFRSENHFALLSRMDRVAEAPETEYANGKGYVPKWQNHWVSDPDTESKLEEMAKLLEMQHELQEGCLLLKGHAGTGKDVLVKMFCERSKRPYFAIDCTKWTTEYELGEDITLESKDGASQTVKVPSVVLQAITTPGAVMYFNEFNAMNEQAQIFLHALMDEKRSITLKTSSGMTVKADPDVLLIASMNPNYPGTFAPQFATRSRMVSVDVDYPSLLVKPKEGDTNPHPCYNVSEPLRIARGVASLSDFTIESNMERNTFVKIWDKYINGIDNGAPDITPGQQFDLEVILALVQFGDGLRADFIKIFEKTEDSMDALPVTQPITLREMRRCAYFLGKMIEAEKLAGDADPEKVAKDLLEKFFLTHIDKKTDREAIQTAMTGSWHSQKRLAA